MSLGDGFPGSETVPNVEVTGDMAEHLMIDALLALDRIEAYGEANVLALFNTKSTGRASQVVFQLGDVFYLINNGEYGNDLGSSSYVNVSTHATHDEASKKLDAIEFMGLSRETAISALGDVDSDRGKVVYTDQEGSHENDAEALRKSEALIARLRQAMIIADN